MANKTLTGREYLDIIDETIRLDIPILMVGSSSIGKSYSITEITKSYGMHGEFLFIGSEKSEYIEGIPNLKASNAEKESKKLSKAEERSGVNSSDEYKFTYLKPFWFPDYLEIKHRLANGRDAFKKGNGKLYKNLDNYDELVSYKNTLNITDEDMKDNADLLYYISMLQGYGNYWLMLDEIDKVEKYDVDKFAPLLHIVRERQLKGWSMKGIDKYNEIKYVPSIKERQSRVDFAIDGMDKDGKPLAKGVDNITDVRIIAIANKSQKITEGALIRRFVHFVVDVTLFEPSPQESNGKWTDEDQERKRKMQFHTCLVDSKVDGDKDLTIGQKMAAINHSEDLAPRLNELNLQWTLGFIPDFMFPMYLKDSKPPDFVRNLFVDNINSKSDTTKTDSYMKKILYDNFSGNHGGVKGSQGLAYTINECIVEQFKGKEVTIDSVKDNAINMLKDGGLSANEYDDISELERKVPKILEIYRKAGIDMSKRLGTSFHAQTVQTSTDDSGDRYLVSESSYSQMENWIKIGTKLVEISIQSGNATYLTKLFILALPLIQKQIVAASPYILQLADKGEKFGFLKTEQSKMGLFLMETLTDLNNPLKEIKEAGVEYAKLLGDTEEGEPIELAQEIIKMYGYNYKSDTKKYLDKYAELEKEGGVRLELKEAIAIIGTSEYSVKDVSCPVLIPQLVLDVMMELPDEAKEYLEGTADYLLVMKEIYGNLIGIISYYVGEDDFEGLKWYIEKFPYRFNILTSATGGRKIFGGLFDRVIKENTDNSRGMAFDKVLNTKPKKK